MYFKGPSAIHFVWWKIIPEEGISEPYRRWLRHSPNCATTCSLGQVMMTQCVIYRRCDFYELVQLGVHWTANVCAWWKMTVGWTCSKAVRQQNSNTNSWKKSWGGGEVQQKKLWNRRKDEMRKDVTKLFDTKNCCTAGTHKSAVTIQGRPWPGNGPKSHRRRKKKMEMMIMMRRSQ
jgi:hypothetical protein